MKQRFSLWLAAICLLGILAHSQAQDFDWQRFSGSTVTVLMPEHPVLTGIEAVLDNFEADTGITVNIESMAENLYFDRMELALRADQGVADVYFLPMDSTAFTQWSAGFIQPLSPYINDPSMTAADYDLLTSQRALPRQHNTHLTVWTSKISPFLLRLKPIRSFTIKIWLTSI